MSTSIMANETPETCMFFVDDSNIWVEAQKFAASGNSRMPKLEDGDQDPRLRINIGKLVDVLRKSRNQGESFLYGSRPPPNDGVWDAFKGFNFKTKIYDRAHCGKEKEVDNSMATDLSQKATELSIRAEYEPSFQRQKASTTFIAITGDRDMLPPIQRVLEYKIPVELWAWESGISTEYLRQSHRNSLLSVHFLNTIFDKISFTKFTSTHKGKSKRVDPAQTVVLCQFVNPDWGNLESFVAEELVEECRLFYTSWSETGEEIFVEFPRVKNIGVMVNKLQRRFEGVSTVVSWPEYANRFNKHSPAVVKTSNKYALLMDDDGEYPTTRGTAKGGHQPVEPNTDLRSVVKPQGANKGSETVEENPNDNDGFETVSRSNPRKSHGRALRNTQRCSDGVRCKKRGDCGYSHTHEERSLFQNLPRQDFRYWKTKKCNNDWCRHGNQCPFAHTEAEAWCLRCRYAGHYTQECQYSSY